MLLFFYFCLPRNHGWYIAELTLLFTVPSQLDRRRGKAMLLWPALFKV